VVGRSIDRQRTASTSNAYLPSRTSMIQQLPLPGGRQSFRRITSCSIALSSDKSATIFFSLPLAIMVAHDALLECTCETPQSRLYAAILALALVCVPAYAGDDKGGDDDTGESATPAKEAPPPKPQYDLQGGRGEAVFVSVRIYRNLDGRIAGVVSVESHPAPCVPGWSQDAV
jgi:hypothetical protein